MVGTVHRSVAPHLWQELVSGQVVGHGQLPAGGAK